MESDIIYKNESFELCEDFIDVGYMAENFEAQDEYNHSVEVRRSHSDHSMTVLVSFPNYIDFKEEILAMDAFLSHLQVAVHCYLIFDSRIPEATVLDNRLKKFQLLFDTEKEFGAMYGTQIVSGSLEDRLTKSLFLVSKDGAIFYLDMPHDLAKPLDLERLQVELNKAYITYTGVGCHG
ncbi:MAG TPA: hypothetical protein ENK86_00580 [Campylobacterales bacterium]|nr:hypothetical protein [Campylobacterales bacterium]